MVDTSKLKLNRVLNAVSARGRMLGNAWGCVGLYYAGIESLSMSYFEHRYDTLCSLTAGAGAGALYKSMSGPRAVVVYGAAGAALAGLNLAAQSAIGRR